jgi:hypothetical protein
VARSAAPVGVGRGDGASSDHRARLVVLRDRLEAAVAEAANRDLAPLAARYQAVLAELAAMPAEDVDELDDLTRRRAARRAGSSAS